MPTNGKELISQCCSIISSSSKTSMRNLEEKVYILFLFSPQYSIFYICIFLNLIHEFVAAELVEESENLQMLRATTNKMSLRRQHSSSFSSLSNNPPLSSPPSSTSPIPSVSPTSSSATSSVPVPSVSVPVASLVSPPPSRP